MLTTLLLLVACTTTATMDGRIEPTFVEVKLDGFDPGTAEAPLAFSSALTEVPVSVRALDASGELADDFTGDLVVKVRPGGLAQDPWVRLENGAWSGTVAIKNGFGPTRIWFSDEGDKDADSGRVPGWAAGVTEAIHYRFPTLSEMQETTDPETNQLAGEFARIRVDDRRVVVTAREAAGFWVTDLDSPTGSGNNLYVYTFSRPTDDYALGTRLGLLGGINQEYLASTQISHPTLETLACEGDCTPPPAAVLDDCADDGMVEGFEGARVRLEAGSVPDDFMPGSEAFADFEQYGQWPVQVGACTWYIESAGAAPDFYAPDLAGQTLPSVEGMLKQIFDKWVLVIVDAADIVTSG